VALALYGVAKADRRWFLLGIVLMLLAKEDMAVYAAALGLYWLLSQRDWKLGGGVAALGLAWLVVVTQKVVPCFRGEGYPYVRSYAYLGNSPEEMVQTVLRNPLLLLETVLAPKRLAAVWRVVWPSGLLGLLSPGLIALSLPAFVYLLAHSDPAVHLLRDWYPAPLQPIFYTATLMGLLWLRGRRWGQGWPARLALVYLVAVGLLAFWQLSPLSPARAAAADRFVVTERARLGHELLKRLPRDASLSVQSDLLPHLAHRQEVYLYPRKVDQVDYVVVDLQGNPYPLRNHTELRDSLFNLLADTDLELWVEGADYYILRRTDGLAIQHPLRAELNGEIALVGFDLAAADERGEFHPLAPPFHLRPGQVVRVALYWDSLVVVDGEYAVFVHLLDRDGWTVGQHDGVPANGYRATSWWGPDWFVRDYHYFSIDGAAPPGPATLVVGMYRRDTLERLTTDAGQDAVLLADVLLGP